MATQNDTTAPAREALAAWDKLFNERESLNGNLDCSKDAAYHQPEGKVPAETVRQLATAAILLEQTNTLLDRVNERQSRSPSENTAANMLDEDTDPDMQPERLELNQTQDRLEDRLGWVYGILDMMQSA